MSYLGRGLEQVDNISKLDNITFNGGTTYALTKDSAAFTPISSNAILISIDGVIQQGNFSVSGTNIVFNFSPTSSNTCDFIMHYGTGVAFTPADSSITKDKTNFVSTSSSSGLQIKGDGTTDGTLQLNCSQNSHGIKLKSPAHSTSSSYTLTFPGTDPAADKMLQTDGSGNLSFVDAPSGTLVQTGSIFNTSNAGPSVGFTNCFSSTYDFYQIHFYFHFANNGAGLRFRIVDSGGERQESQYQYASPYKDSSNSDGQHTSESETYINISNSNSQGYDDGGIHGVLQVHLNNGHGTTSHSNTFSMTGYYKNSPDNGQNRVRAYHHASNYIDTIANHTATGFNFYSTSGNLEFANVKVYGLDGSSS
jgi:hypothetical protein